MVDNNLDIAALLGSRICHDLISPIGAIANGLELLELTGTTPGPEMDLISESVRNANARIRFFRIAFGSTGPQMMGRSEIMSVLQDVGSTGRIDMNWVPVESHARSMVRLAFLAILCCETAMPHGGSIRIDCENDCWTVTGKGSSVMIDPDLWANFAEPAIAEQSSSATVHFALFANVALDLGRTVSVEHGPDTLTIRY